MILGKLLYIKETYYHIKYRIINQIVWNIYEFHRL